MLYLRHLFFATVIVAALAILVFVFCMILVTINQIVFHTQEKASIAGMIECVVMLILLILLIARTRIQNELEGIY